MKRLFLFTLIVSISIISFCSFTEISKIYIPNKIKSAYINKTRSLDGNIGQNYWQNAADYKINVELNPETRLLIGSEKITYFNNSPNALNEIVFHLFPNLYKKGNSRDFMLLFDDESDGLTITEMKINGEIIDPSLNSRQLEYRHTSLILYLDKPLLAGDKIEFDISWNYILNENSHMRTGLVDPSSFFVAYFFPRIAVYDDIDGWNLFKYMGDAEFYNDFGNYDVSITMPQNFIVWASGTLENPEQLLRKKYLKRYKKAFSSDEIIHIIDSTEYNQKNITIANIKNTWKFKANNITDFAFATSDHYLWDASSLVVDKESGRRVFIDAAYEKNSDDFYQVASIARKAIEYMSFQLPGVAFPFPKVTVFNGRDQMEYPMMVNDISNENIIHTIKLTSHEILHSYLPFYTGINETKYAWMDEGFTCFGEHEIVENAFAPIKGGFYFLEDYKKVAGDHLDVPIFVSSKYLKRPTYAFNAYPKPAGFFLVLKDLLGDEIFNKCLHAFIDRWKGKHPTPYDFFFTFSNIAEQNLDWLIKPWFYEFGYVDLAIKNISKEEDGYEIIIERKGHFPAPIHLNIFFTDGSIETINETAEVWKNGDLQYFIKNTSSKKIKTLELLDPSLLDVDLSNNLIRIQE